MLLYLCSLCLHLFCTNYSMFTATRPNPIGYADVFWDCSGREWEKKNLRTVLLL